jgi:protein gp37
MGENTKIEWCDHTMNFWIGCQEVSPACDHCYARTLNDRRKWVAGWGPHGERRRTAIGNWHKLRKWNRAAEKSGVRARVFCNSLSDFFDNKAPSEWRREAWHYIEQSPHLDFLILTKRPKNIVAMLPDPETGVRPWGDGWPNVWLGTTAEDQTHLAERAWHLAQVPAVVRFLSYEPALGPIDLRAVTNRWGTRWNALTGNIQHPASGPRETGAISWVICGGESGPGRRPIDLEWARYVRDDCRFYGKAYFFKQVDKVQPIPPDLMIRQFPAPQARSP